MKFQCKKCKNITSKPFKCCPSCGRKNPIYGACKTVAMADYIFNEMVMQSKIAVH